MIPFLKIQSLTVQLNKRQVLKEVSLTFDTSELVVLVGPNGAGKTTLLRSLAGLVPEVASHIEVQGSLLKKLSFRDRKNIITYLPQNGTISADLSVGDVIALGAPLQDNQDRAMVDAGLEGFKDRSVACLSGGELSRVLLARALAQQTPVLLADEPVAALDIRHQFQVLKALKARSEMGILVIIVLHDLGLAARFGDRIIVLNQGQVVADGTPQDALCDKVWRHTFGIEKIEVNARSAGE